MEMPEPDVYSQMMHMFPNIPQDIIWRYVQLYSSDVEKCAQMLNFQNVKYSGLQLTATENKRNLNEFSSIQSPCLILNPEIVGDNNNDLIVNHEYEEQTEQTSYDSHSSYSTSLVSPNVTEKNDVTINTSRNTGATVNFNEPLILDIVPDDEGISHSWRPSNSDDMLCPNIFVPSPMTENYQLPSCQIPNWNLQENHLEFHLNPKTEDIDSGKYSMTAQMLYNYPLPDWRDSGKDIASYLHYQKSQMNAVRYEVIKARIELSGIKENAENLESELKEKTQSKSEHDIIDLNKEIEQLRLDCQCLFTEIDEINDNINHASTNDITTAHRTNSSEINRRDNQEESNKWQCSNCTFANHPAINVCEMCRLPKSVTRRPSFLPTPSGSCYCHPRESTLPIHS